MKLSKMTSATITVGVDLGDRYCRFCMLNADSGVIEEGRIRTSPSAIQGSFEDRYPMRIIIEVGTHSPWVSRLLEALGHQVLVANPRKVRLIYASNRKTDRLDAEALARLGRLDPQLLAPIRHRGPEAQADLAQLRARECLVRARTQLVNHVRGAVKAVGGRLPRVSTAAFAAKVIPHLPEELRPAITPLLSEISELTAQIRRADRQLETLAERRYPETERLRQIAGVGPLTALCFVLTLEEPTRFRSSRSVAAYLGLCPRQHDSGTRTPQLSISKAGDPMLRRLLVTAAQYILGPFGPDCDLRRWGLILAARGGNNAKKRAVVAVARRLAGVLHRLWISGEPYQPLLHTTNRNAA
jgi:transposase